MTIADIITAAQRRCRPIAVSILRSLDDADDVLQNAALQAFKHRRAFRAESKFDTWFTRIVINESYMALRRAHSRRLDVTLPLDEAAFVLSKDQSPYDLAVKGQRLDKLYELARHLSPVLHSEFALALVDDLPGTDSTRKGRAHRMRKRFRELLLEEAR